MPVHELRRGIGYVIQQAGLFPHRTVADNIATVPQAARLGQEAPARARARADRARRARAGHGATATRASSPAASSSASASPARSPPTRRVLLMDEPFGAVDPVRRGALQQEFKRLQRDLGKTVVFVTHDVDEAVLLGDRIAIMQEGGKVAQYGPPEALLAQPASDFVASFIGGTRGIKLLSLRPAADVPVTEVGAGGIAGWTLRTDDDGRPLEAWVRAGDVPDVPAERVGPGGLAARPARLARSPPPPAPGARRRARHAARRGAVRR